MKIENLTSGGLTFVTADGEAVTVRAGETSDDLKIRAEDPRVVSHLNAQNIRLSGRGAPKADQIEPAAPAPTRAVAE